ncbi:hypothetical protein O9992_21825 [Vibrio lentus]|nr:hypothetical protein [Vibrio lentus]
MDRFEAAIAGLAWNTFSLRLDKPGIKAKPTLANGSSAILIACG